jgi:hypothetical protein
MSQPPDPFEFMKSLWAPMGLPGVLAPTLKVDEVDRRIAELKSVENWLNMNLAALRMTVQGLEMQRATLAAVQGLSAGTGQTAAGGARDADPAEAARRFADAWWKMLQQAQPGDPTGSAQPRSAGPGQGNEPGKK